MQYYKMVKRKSNWQTKKRNKTRVQPVVAKPVYRPRPTSQSGINVAMLRSGLVPYSTTPGVPRLNLKGELIERDPLEGRLNSNSSGSSTRSRGGGRTRRRRR